ncbi:hypothetical protein RUM44_011134 [Polyplax serrata]|uniref:Uncharacterized protein n=1 Tax=Polyplax serrata TaxID=468196 RepID=A0ABR1AP71_POLSC
MKKLKLNKSLSRRRKSSANSDPKTGRENKWTRDGEGAHVLQNKMKRTNDFLTEEKKIFQAENVLSQRKVYLPGLLLKRKKKGVEKEVKWESESKGVPRALYKK